MVQLEGSYYVQMVLVYNQPRMHGQDQHRINGAKVGPLL